MSRFSLACLLRGAVAMVLLIAPPAATAKAQGASAPPPSLERLLQAARTGDVAGVASALSAGAPIDGGDPKWGETALMRAAAFGQRATVQALLAAGANPRAESAGKRTALHAAAEGGDVDVIRDLLARGLPVDDGADRGDTPLTVACAARQPAAIEALVAAGARHEALGSDCGTLADLIGRSLANDTGARDLPVIRAFIRARSGLEVPGRVLGHGLPVRGEPLALQDQAAHLDAVPVLEDVGSHELGAVQDRGVGAGPVLEDVAELPGIPLEVGVHPGDRRVGEGHDPGSRFVPRVLPAEGHPGPVQGMAGSLPPPPGGAGTTRSPTRARRVGR